MMKLLTKMAKVTPNSTNASFPFMSKTLQADKVANAIRTIVNNIDKTDRIFLRWSL